MFRDFRFAFRVLAKSPGFALVAIVALALGIGANTAIFSVVNTVLLKALPYRDASRLVLIQERIPQFSGSFFPFPRPIFATSRITRAPWTAWLPSSPASETWPRAASPCAFRERASAPT